MDYLKINNEKIPLRIERARGRQVSLGFAKDQLVVVLKIPGGKITPQVHAFLEKKQQWIWKHYCRLKQQFLRKEEFYQRLEDGEGLYLGKWYPLNVYSSRAFGVNVTPEEIQLSVRGKQNGQNGKNILVKAYRELAKSYLIPRTWEWAYKTESQVQKIFVKNHKSKWGSCSSMRNVNLNWHLIFLPEPLIDYLIIHELMHLKEMNHSPAYWRWVASYYPDYKTANKLLDEYNWVIGVLE